MPLPVLARTRPAALAAAVVAALLATGQHPAIGQTVAPAAPTGSESTTLALIRLLVQEGILSREKAQALLVAAEQQAAAAAANRAATPAPETVPPGAVRVPYVPEVVRKQIREEVKQEVLTQAKTERWGDPGTLPDWLDRVRFSGDLRVRYRRDIFDNGNEGIAGGEGYPDFQAINDGSFGVDSTVLPGVNRNQDDNRLQLRARLGIDADLSNGFSTGIRVATGNQLNPISTNDNLDTALGSENFNLDRGFIQYQGDVQNSGGELRAQAGRFANPFFATDLLFDEDLNFDGVAARYTYPVSRTLRPFVTAGYFPLEYLDFSSRDKTLWAAQIGADWQAHPQVGVRVGAAYYDFDNVRGQPDACDVEGRNSSVPARLVNGNTLYDVSCTGSTVDQLDDRLQYGLASEFKIVNLTGQVDVARFAPIHVVATGDVAINTGYQQSSVERRASTGVPSLVTDGTGDKAYMARLLVGHPEINRRHEWNTILTYKYLETDAVLDAFTDSDFHLGGTNAKGYSIFGNYGVADRVAIGARWYSSDQIDGPKFGVDTFMLELNAKF